MIFNFRIEILISFFAIVLLFFAHPGIAQQFKVTHVYDGDTIKVISNGEAIIIRLAGIDAPEVAKKGQPGQPYSELATDYLEALVLNKSVKIKTFGFDRHNNALGVVVIEGINVNLKMLRRGLAEVYSNNLPKDFNLRPYYWQEAEARKVRRHIWRQGDDYISPREWRKQQTQ